ERTDTPDTVEQCTDGVSSYEGQPTRRRSLVRSEASGHAGFLSCCARNRPYDRNRLLQVRDAWYSDPVLLLQRHRRQYSTLLEVEHLESRPITRPPTYDCDR